MTETSNCVADGDAADDDAVNVLPTDLGPQPLTIMKAR